MKYGSPRRPATSCRRSSLSSRARTSGSSSSLATTEAETAVAGQLGVALLLVVSASCVSGSLPTGRPADSPLPTPARRDPEIRVGVVVGAATARLGGSEALVVNEPDGT